MNSALSAAMGQVRWPGSGIRATVIVTSFLKESVLDARRKSCACVVFSILRGN